MFRVYLIFKVSFRVDFYYYYYCLIIIMCLRICIMCSFRILFYFWWAQQRPIFSPNFSPISACFCRPPRGQHRSSQCEPVFSLPGLKLGPATKLAAQAQAIGLLLAPSPCVCLHADTQAPQNPLLVQATHQLNKAIIFPCMAYTPRPHLLLWMGCIRWR